MYQINFDSPVHVHFIGIGGISMSGLAEVLLQEGFTISGSDSQRSELTRHLEEKGATVFYGQTADNINQASMWSSTLPPSIRIMPSCRCQIRWHSHADQS